MEPRGIEPLRDGFKGHPGYPPATPNRLRDGPDLESYQAAFCATTPLIAGFPGAGAFRQTIRQTHLSRSPADAMSALGRRAARAAPESSTLKLEDREAKGGRGRAAAEAGNVVRLPREWLGPPEELIPFGPSAGATAEERSEPPRQDG